MEEQLLSNFFRPILRRQFADLYYEGLKKIRNKSDDEIDYEIEFMIKNSKSYSIDDSEWKAYDEEVYNYALSMLPTLYL